MRASWQSGWVGFGLALFVAADAKAEAPCSDCEEQFAVVYRDGPGLVPRAELWRGWDGNWVRSYELAKVPVVVGGTFWEITTHSVKVPWLDCRCVMDEVQRDPSVDEELACTKQMKTEWPVAVSPSGEVKQLAQTPSDCGGEGGSYAPGVTYLGIYDGLVTLTAQGSSNGCGAHTTEWVNFAATSLPSGERAPLWNGTEAGVVTDELRSAVIRQLTESYKEASAEELAEIRNAAYELSAAEARWVNGRLQPRWLLSRGVCYACGNGLWNSYTEGIWVEAPAPLPSRLARYAQLTPAPRSLATAAPNAIGYALLPQVTLPERLFAPAPPAKKGGKAQPSPRK